MVGRAFTVIELLATIAIVAVLASLLVPGLAHARAQARATVCAAKARQIALATRQYMDDWRECLPQTRVVMPCGQPDVRATLFAGERGDLPLMGVNQAGVSDRPLNPYLDARLAALHDEPNSPRTRVEAVRSPLDRGATATFFGLPEFEAVPSIAGLMGTSYVLNDHDLDGDLHRTLIPEGGGRMPDVFNPSRTWLVASAPIYNFKQDSDRGMRWFEGPSGRCHASIAFVDLHARVNVPVPNIWCVVENVTEHYSFFPGPDNGPPEVWEP